MRALWVRSAVASIAVVMVASGCQAGPDFSAAAIASARLGEGLPPSFMLGVATSGFQIEGDNTDDWSTWETGLFADGTPHVAGRARGRSVGSWTLWPKDVIAMQYLGANAYRMGIEWSRLEPQQGVWDLEAISHYRQQLQALKDAGITPLVTVNHIALPPWVSDQGGWEWPGMVDALGTLGEHMGAAFGDLVDNWVTVNEPNAIFGVAYVIGRWPPGVTDNARAVRVYANTLAGHAAIAAALRRTDLVDADGDGKATFIGLAHNMSVIQPASATAGDLLAAAMADRLINQSVLEAVQSGVIDMSFPGTPGVHRDAPELIGTFDYVGLNYYRRNYVRIDDVGVLQITDFSPAGRPASGLGWEIYAKGFYETLMRCKAFGWPVIITENGVADNTDAIRPDYLRAHLYAMQQAMKDGVDVRGYFHWTLMDNYELNDGFTEKVGLFSVDPEDPQLQRVPKASAEVFREAARGMGLTPGTELP